MEVGKDKEGQNEIQIKELRESLLKLEQQHTEDLETIREMEHTIRQLKMDNAKYKSKEAVTKIQAVYRSRLGRKRFDKLVDNLNSIPVDDVFTKYDVDRQGTFSPRSSSEKSEPGYNTFSETKSETKDGNGPNNNERYDKVRDHTLELSNLTKEEGIILSVFNTIDPEHKGFISKRKFLHAIQLNEDVQELLSTNPRLGRLKHSKSLRDEFRTMDENDDKMISIEEMLHYSTPRAKHENADKATAGGENVVKNVNALNDTGETQLDIAIRENNTDLIESLENNGGKTSNQLSHNKRSEEATSHQFKHKSSKYEVQFSEADDDTLSEESTGEEGMIDNV